MSDMLERALAAARKDQAAAATTPATPVVPAEPPATPGEAASFDVTRAQQRAAKKLTGQDIAADVVMSPLTGVERGIVGAPGIPGDIAHTMIGIQNWLRRKAGPQGLGVPGVSGEPLSTEGSEYIPPTSQKVLKAAEPYVPGVGYRPETKAGEFLQGAAELATPNVIGAVGKADKIRQIATELIAQGVVPEAASWAAEHLAKGTSWEDIAGPLAAFVASGGATKLPRGDAPKVDLPGGGTMHPAAADQLVQSIVNDVQGRLPKDATPGQLFDEVRKELEKLGPEGRLPDVGKNLQLEAQALTSQPGAPRADILRDVLERHKAAGDRISTTVDRTMGGTTDFTQRSEQILAQRKADADRLYGEARSLAQPVDTKPILDHIDSKIAPEVISGDRAATSLERAKLRVRNVLEGRTDVDSLHSVKVDLDGQIGEATRAGNKPLATELGGIKDKLVESLDNATIDPKTGQSKYKEARQTFASDSADLAARDDGRDIFKRTMTPYELQKSMAGMTATELENYKQGAREAVTIEMDNARNDALAARNMFKSNNNREKLIQIVGQEKADDLIKTLEAETRMAETHGKLSQQSVTAERGAKQKTSAASPDQLQPPPIGVGQWPAYVGRKAWDLVTGGMATRRGERVAGDLSTALMTPAPSQGQLLTDLQRVYEHGQRPRPIANTAGPLLAPGVEDRRQQRLGPGRVPYLPTFGGT